MIPLRRILGAFGGRMADAGLAFGLMVPATDYDLIRPGGRIVDGAGNPWYVADLAVRGDRIARIGHLKGARAPRAPWMSRAWWWPRLHRHAGAVRNQFTDRPAGGGQGHTSKG